MGFFFFLYVGTETSTGNLLTTFSVLCKLKLSRPVGAEVQAVFWGAFTLVRFLAIFAAVWLAPIVFMTISTLLCIIGGTLLCYLAEYSLSTLQAGSAVLGGGLATMYATGDF